MPNLDPLPPLEIEHAHGTDTIRMTAVPKEGTNAIIKFSDSSPAPVMVKVRVFIAGEEVNSWQDYTPFVGPIEVPVSRSQLLNHVGTGDVEFAYRLEYGGNPSETEPRAYKISHA